MAAARTSPAESAVLEECRWQLDWMLRMLVPAGQPFAGMAFHRVHGTSGRRCPGLPHEDPTTRVLHRPSTAATLHVAAVAARGARASAVDAPTRPGCWPRPAGAHAAAHRHPRLVAPDDEGRFGGGPYGDDRARRRLLLGRRGAVAGHGRASVPRRARRRRAHRRRVRPRGVRLRPRRRARPDRPRAAGERAAGPRPGAASVVAAGERLLALQAGSRGGSRTRPAPAGTGARTGGS